jgi:putative Ca2+/H+ antiporter (TMEM165/GDT1 family)
MRAATRAVAFAAGGAAVAFGLWQLIVVAPSATRPVAAAVWLTGVLLAHDALLAPAALVVGVLLVRGLPRRMVRPLAATLLAALSLALVAAPGLLRP